MYSRLTKKIVRGRLDNFLSRHKNNGKVLDIGSGGELYKYSRYFPNITSIDIDPERNPDIVGDAHKLPFPDGQFDTILCTEVLEHLHSPHIAISEMRRVLKQGGLLILTTRFIFPLHDTPNDYFRYTKYGLRYLFKDWDILELEEEADTQTTIAILMQRIGYQTRIRFNRISKIIVFILAKIISKFPRLILEEYGDIKKTTSEKSILCSGYYLVARRK